MGLIHCPDCHGTVSENADMCIHCGAPLMLGVQRKIEALKEEKKLLEEQLKKEYEKYAEKKRQIMKRVYGTPAEQAAAESFEKKGTVISIIVSAIVLLIHLFNPNWWLLLTLPICLLIIVFGITEMIEPGSYRSLDDPPSQKEVEAKRLLAPVEREYNTAIFPIKQRIRAINDELNTYPHI